MLDLEISTREVAVEGRDPRVKLAITMSPTGAGVWSQDQDSWKSIETPCMTFIGTLDFDLVVTLNPQTRRIVYDGSAGPDQFLITLGGALHTAFDDQLPWRRYHDYIKMASTAFLDAHLKGDADALQWLLQRSLTQLTRGVCVVEYKNITTVD